MKIIQNNPYRIAGILSNASAREIQKQKGKIRAFSRVGKAITSEFDFSFLNPIERTEKMIEKAFSSIEQNQDKINNSLFWFLNASPFDETALSYLVKGDNDKAKEIWGKITNGKEVNSRNFSAFNNIGTIKLLSKSKFEIKEGIEAKIKLIESEYFENFVHKVADQTFTIDSKKQSQILINELLSQFKNQYSSADTLDLFSNCNSFTQNYLSTKFTEEPMHNIESNIASTKQQRKNDKSNAYFFGEDLYKNTKNDLSILKSLLGIDNLNYKRIADELAKEIMQCSIDYFNESQELERENNYLENSMKLAKIAETIAIGKFTKDKAKDNINSLEEMKDREINQAIAILSSIKLAYDKAISEINAQVSMMSMTMSYNQTINFSKVDKIKANCLDWSKVVEVVRNGISVNDITIIQHCLNQNKISEYKNLVNFLFSKLGPIQINKIQYICFWKDVKTAQAKSAAKKIGRTVMDTATSVNDASGGCFGAIISWVIGVIIFIITIAIIGGIISLFD